MTVYRLRAVTGHGWIADVDDRGPIITATKAAAKSWDDLEAARRALRRTNQPGKVRHEIVAEPR